MDGEARDAIEVVRQASRTERDALLEEVRGESERGRERLMLDRGLDQRIQRHLSQSRNDLMLRIAFGVAVLFAVVITTLAIARTIYR